MPARVLGKPSRGQLAVGLGVAALAVVAPLAYRRPFLVAVACCLLGVLLLTALAALASGLVYAWKRRLALLPLAAKRFAKVSLGLGELTVRLGWAPDPRARLRALDAPLDSAVVCLGALVIYSPFTPDPEEAEADGTASRGKKKKKGLASGARSLAGRAAGLAPKAPAFLRHGQGKAAPSAPTEPTEPPPAADGDAAAPAGAPAAGTDVPAASGAEIEAAAAAGSGDVLVKAEVVNADMSRVGFRRWEGQVCVSGAEVRFVAYDMKFTDTNIKRLQDQLAPPEEATPAAAEAEQDKAPEAATPAAVAGPAAAAPDLPAAPASVEPPPFALRSVRLQHVTLRLEMNLSGRADGGRLLLPPIIIDDEQVPLDRLLGPPSLALLAWFNALALRTLASSSVQLLRSLADLPVFVADEAIRHTLDSLDGLVGGAVAALGADYAGDIFSGATGAVRSVWSGACGGVGHALDGVSGGALAAARGVATGEVSGLLRGLGDGTAAVMGGAAACVGAASTGVAEGVSHAARGIDTAAGRIAPAPARHLLGGAAEGAATVVGGVCSGVTAAAAGVGEGGSRLATGVLGGTAAGARAIAAGDAAGIRDAGAQVVGGVAGGVGATAHGAAAALTAVGQGVGTGVCTAAGGVVRAASETSNAAAKGWGGIFGKRKSPAPSPSPLGGKKGTGKEVVARCNIPIPGIFGKRHPPLPPRRSLSSDASPAGDAGAADVDTFHDVAPAAAPA